jgi:hypothetical protein
VARQHIFADESGTFVRSRARNVSRYFYVGTLHIDEDTLSRLRNIMAVLRDNLALRNLGLNSYFHAAQDSVPIRRAVFEVLAEMHFRIDVTMVDKGKAPPELRPSTKLFAYTWQKHLANLAPRIMAPRDELLLTAAALGTRRQRTDNRKVIEDAMRAANLHETRWILAFWPSASDVTLQVTDYCLWAVQRSTELGDETFYTMIKDKVYTMVDVWEGDKWLEY